MKCLGEYRNTNKQTQLIHYPFGIDDDFQIEKPEYYLTQECTEHQNCTKSSVRGIPFHGTTLNVNAMIFSGNEIVNCEHPLFYSYENPPSSSERHYDFDGMFELLDMVCLFIF